MSGGEIDHYLVSEIGINPRLKEACPEIAELCRDLGDVLYKMDYYICGDTLKGSAYNSWRAFANKWNKKLKKIAEVPKIRCCALCGGVGEYTPKIVSGGWEHDEIRCANCGMLVKGSDYEDVTEKWNSRYSDA